MPEPIHSVPNPARKGAFSVAEIQEAVDSILSMPDEEFDRLAASAKAEADAAPDFWKNAAENLFTTTL